MKVPRDVNMANVKFIRIGGDAPAAGRSGSAGSRRARAASPTPSPAAVGGGGGANPYPGDNASKASARRVDGREAEKRGLPKQLPVMASLVESGVKNLNYGDADSVGFFQMRVGIWNQGDYAGFPEKPELQVKWFLDQAEAVKKQRIAAGKSVTDPKQFGDWIADIERPAEQYRGRYGLRLDEANGLLAPRPETDAPVGGAGRAGAGGGRGRRRGGGRPERGWRRRGGRARSRRSPRPRSTRASRTSGAARRRRPASTAPASRSGRTRRRASRSRA